MLLLFIVIVWQIVFVCCCNKCLFSINLFSVVLVHFTSMLVSKGVKILLLCCHGYCSLVSLLVCLIDWLEWYFKAQSRLCYLYQDSQYFDVRENQCFQTYPTLTSRQIQGRRGAQTDHNTCAVRFESHSEQIIVLEDICQLTGFLRYRIHRFLNCPKIDQWQIQLGAYVPPLCRQ